MNKNCGCRWKIKKSLDNHSFCLYNKFACVLAWINKTGGENNANI